MYPVQFFASFNRIHASVISLCLGFSLACTTDNGEPVADPGIVVAPISIAAETAADAARGSLADLYLASREVHGNTRFMSAYHTTTFYNGLSGVVNVLGAAHIAPWHQESIRGTATRGIVEIAGILFTTVNGSVEVNPSIDASLAALQQSLDLNLVYAFYLWDEPYAVGIRRDVLEAAITHVNTYFPNIPTYITFAHHCFSPDSQDPACVTPPQHRGIPANLDWVGFDYYSDVPSADIATADAKFNEHVVYGVQLLKSLTNKPIILVPEVHLQWSADENVAIYLLDRYMNYATSEMQVLGVDMFTWQGFPPAGQPGGEGNGWAGVDGMQWLYGRIRDYGTGFLCRAGNCPGVQSVPRGPFRVMTNGVMSALFSTGSAYCGFTDPAQFLHYFGSDMTSYEFRMFPRMPNLPYAGACQ